MADGDGAVYKDACADVCADVYADARADATACDATADALLDVATSNRETSQGPVILSTIIHV